MTTTTEANATHQVVDFGAGVNNRDETLGYPVEGSEAECAKYAEELNASYPNVRTNGKDRFCIQEIPTEDDEGDYANDTPFCGICGRNMLEPKTTPCSNCDDEPN